MNEIAVEKIVDLIHKNNLIHSLLSIPSRHLAQKILRELEELGYHKLPQEKPPLLTPNDIYYKVDKVDPGVSRIERDLWIAQAQLDICIKHYEGGK